MTEAEYLAMSDRERNEWIADNIMDGERYDWKYDGEPLKGVWPYSTDYNAMHRVIEKMRGEGWHFSIDTFSEGYMVTVPDKKAPFGHCSRIQKNFQDAVYLAAGRALGAIDG